MRNGMIYKCLNFWQVSFEIKVYINTYEISLTIHNDNLTKVMEI